MIPILTLAVLLGAPSDASNTTAPIVRCAPSDLIEEGKRLLAHGKDAEALAKFEEAHAAGGGIETELWVLRGRLATGDLDAIDRVVAIEVDGHESTDLTYVLGAGRYEFAKDAESKGDGRSGGAFQEAAGYLKRATAAEPEAYPDAWLMLAEAARFTGQPEVATEAIERALRVHQSVDALFLAAKIRIARGSGLVGDDGTAAAGKKLIQQGIRDAEKAASQIDGEKDAARMADLHLQIAVGELFLEDREAAMEAYAEALGWDPTQADFNIMLNALRDAKDGDKPFIATLRKGNDSFVERWGESNAANAGLLWWLGYTQYYAGAYDDAIAAFQEAVTKFPAYSNSHWYIGASHYMKSSDGVPKAAEAWKKFARSDMQAFVQMVGSDEGNSGMIGGAIGILWQNSQGGANLEIAFDLAELMTRVERANPEYWNNLGLMGRDAGDWVRRAKPEDPDMTAEQYYERAWDAYNEAIDLARKPQYLNDGAVILHYGLERDYDKALEMYEEAEKLAQEMVDANEFPEGEEEVVRIALRDAKNNRKALEAKMKKRDGAITR